VWGRNTEGQLGIATLTTTTDDQGNTTSTFVNDLSNRNTPTPVSKTSSSTVDKDSVTPNAGLTDNWLSIAAGYQHSVAVNQAGELYVCGTNKYGSMGLSADSTVPAMLKLTDERNWLKVSAGNYHTVIINAAGDLYATGRNNYGQLGNNTTTDISSVTLISTDYDWDFPAAGYDFTAAIGNIKVAATTTSTTEAPLTFTETITIGSDGQATGSGGVFALGTENDQILYNIPETTSALPLNSDVYKNGSYLFTFTATVAYSGATIKHISASDSSETFVVLSDGRVDV
jgi:hypothetical protein